MVSRIILLHLQEQTAQQGIRAVEMGFAALDEVIELGGRVARAQVNGFAQLAQPGHGETEQPAEQPIGVLYDGLDAASAHCHTLLREYARHAAMRREFMQDLLKCMMCMPVSAAGEEECEDAVVAAKPVGRRSRSVARSTGVVTMPE